MDEATPLVSLIVLVHGNHGHSEDLIAVEKKIGTAIKRKHENQKFEIVSGKKKTKQNSYNYYKYSPLPNIFRFASFY